jgi:hypothetical protein
MFRRAHACRRASTTTVASIALTASLAIAGVSHVAAEGGASDNRALVGCWLETVTFPPASGRPPLKSLSSFHDGGTMNCSDQGAVTTTDPPTVFTSCHGAWTHMAKRTFAYTAFELMSDLSGNLLGYLKVRGVYTVSASGNAYTGTSFAQILDADGHVLFSAEVTNTGQRILVELP